MNTLEKVEIPAKMMALKLTDKVTLYNSYMPFLKNGGLFVPTEDIFSLGDAVLLAVEIGNHPKKYLTTEVAWINPARTSVQRPKGVGLAFVEVEGQNKNNQIAQVKHLIEAELGGLMHQDRPTFTL